MKPNDETEALLNRARTAGAMRLINKMFADGILEKVGNGFRPVHPKLWRNKPGDKNYNALRRDIQMMVWDQEVRAHEDRELVGHPFLDEAYLHWLETGEDEDLARVAGLLWAWDAFQGATRADLRDVEFLAQAMRRVARKAESMREAARLRKARRLERIAGGG
jgi:hypothetical protein